jgi:hypothetical protein
VLFRLKQGNYREQEDGTRRGWRSEILGVAIGSQCMVFDASNIEITENEILNFKHSIFI